MRARHFIYLAIPLLSTLAACGQSPSTPLAHVLLAFRAGDHSDFLVAKNEVEEQFKTAIKSGDDVCKANQADIVKYDAHYIAEKLDQDDLFRSPEEDRFLYALKVTNPTAVLHPESFLSQTPFGRPNEKSNCPGGMMPALIAGGSAYTEDKDARLAVLNDWMAAMKGKYGDKLDETMQAAKAHLSNVGYTGSWPVDLDK